MSYNIMTDVDFDQTGPYEIPEVLKGHLLDLILIAIERDRARRSIEISRSLYLTKLHYVCGEERGEKCCMRFDLHVSPEEEGKEDVEIYGVEFTVKKRRFIEL